MQHPKIKGDGIGMGGRDAPAAAGEQVRFGGDRDPAAGEMGNRWEGGGYRYRYLCEARCDGAGGEAAGEGDVTLGAVVPRHGCCGAMMRREANRGMDAVECCCRSGGSRTPQPATPTTSKAEVCGRRAEKQKQRQRDRNGTRTEIINQQQDKLLRRLGLGFRLDPQNFFSYFFIPFFSYI